MKHLCHLEYANEGHINFGFLEPSRKTQSEKIQVSYSNFSKDCSVLISATPVRSQCQSPPEKKTKTFLYYIQLWSFWDSF